MHPTWPTRRPILRVSVAARPKIVALGDSYTAHHHSRGYQAFNGPINIANALLDQGFAFTAAENFGIGGQTSAEIAARLPQALEARPDLLVICAGSNDVRGRTTPDDTRAALTAMAEMAQTAGVDTLFLTVPPRVQEKWPEPAQQAHAIAANAHLATLAERLDRVSLCDCFAPNIMAGGGYVAVPETTYDGTHLSAIGAWRAGQVLAECLRDRAQAAEDDSATLTPTHIAPEPGGRVGEGASGMVAQGWRLRRHEGTAEAEAVFAPDGQDIFVIPGTGASGFLFEADPAVIHRGLVPGHRARGFARITAHASAAWDYLFLEVVEEDTDGNAIRALYPATQVRPVPGDADMRLSLLTDPLELMGNSGLRLRLRFGVRGGVAASARLTIHRLGVRLA